MDNKIEELLADFLEDKLSFTQKRELEIYFKENPDAEAELFEMKKTFNAIQKPTEIEFDSKKDDVFYQFLAEEKNESDKISKKKSFKVYSIFQNSIFKYAAGLAGLLFTFWIGRQSVQNQLIRQPIVNIEPPTYPVKTVEKIVKVPEIIFQTKYISQKEKTEKINIVAEIGNLKKEMQATKDLLITSLLKKESASDRILGVNYSYELDRPDNEVLKALIFTLDNDQNINVRTAAADAIARFGYDDFVRNALINSLLKQNEPSLQVSIIETLTKLHERRALPAFKLLADDSGTADEVKQKAEQGTKLLSI